MYCKKCGSEIDKGTKFCPECGAAVAVNSKKEKREKTKKPIYKRWWFWTIVIIFLLGSCGSSGETADVPAVAETAPVQITVETTESIETTISETTAETTVAAEDTAPVTVSVETAITFIEASMKDNFKNYNISHDDNIITINVWEDGIAIGATLAAAGDAECLEAWSGMVDNQVYFCNSIWELVKTLGLTDTAVVVNVLNDGNLENVLLTTMNGIVFYNSVTD